MTEHEEPGRGRIRRQEPHVDPSIVEVVVNKVGSLLNNQSVIESG